MQELPEEMLKPFILNSLLKLQGMSRKLQGHRNLMKVHFQRGIVASDKKEQLGTTIEHNLDSGKSMEDCSNSVVELLDFRLVGDIKVQETPTREEITVGHTPSDAPTSLKEDIRHKQEKTQKENTFVDWGNYSFRMDGFQKLVSANENDDLLAKSTKDDHVSDLQSSARCLYIVAAISEQSSQKAGEVLGAETPSSRPLEWNSFHMHAVVASTEDRLKFILSEKGFRVRLFIVRDILKVADIILQDQPAACMFNEDLNPRQTISNLLMVQSLLEQRMQNEHLTRHLPTH